MGVVLSWRSIGSFKANPKRATIRGKKQHPHKESTRSVFVKTVLALHLTGMVWGAQTCTREPQTPQNQTAHCVSSVVLFFCVFLSRGRNSCRQEERFTETCVVIDKLDGILLSRAPKWNTGWRGAVGKGVRIDPLGASLMKSVFVVFREPFGWF